MSRDPATLRRYRLAAWLSALVLLAPGCSQDPKPDPSTAPAEVFSPAELEAMRKSVKTLEEYHQLVKVKHAERLRASVSKEKPQAQRPPK